MPYAAANIEQRRAMNAARRQAQTVALKEAVRLYKVEKGCVDCGYNEHHAGLEFDHRPGEEKDQTVAWLAGKGKISRTWAEVKKCDVVCGTCHRIRTWNRGREVL